MAVAVAATALLGHWAQRGRSPWFVVALGALFVATAGWQQLELTRVETRFDAWAAAAIRRGDASAARALPIAATRVRGLAMRALDAPTAPTAGFRYLATLDGIDRRTSVVLYRNGLPVSWAGEPRAVPEVLRGDLGVERFRFYLVLYAAERRGDAVAVATMVLDADPPARHLVDGLGADLARRASVGAIEFAPPGPADENGFRPWLVDGEPLLRYRALAPTRGNAVTLQLETARGLGGSVLAAWALALIVAAWRRRPSLAEQLGALAAGAMVVGLVPLGALSNVSWVFDPSVYFVRVGGVTVAGLAALLLSGALLTLAGLALRRARPAYKSRLVPGLVLGVLVPIGPFLLRALGSGIKLPVTGTPTALWLAWQIGIFLFAAVVLLGAAAAGRAWLRGDRGVDPMVGPSLAVVAAALGPRLWQPEGAWNNAYTLLWITVIVCTALSRATRGVLLQVGVVAALGATVLTWGGVMRRTVELATFETARLTASDPEAAQLLERFASQLVEQRTSPRSRADLLDRVAASDLVARYPLTAATWRLDGTLIASLDVFGQTEELEVRAVIERAIRTGRPSMSDVVGYPGIYQVLAVPFADSTVTTVIVEPRARALVTPAVAALLGYASPTSGAPPYRFELGEVQADRKENDGMRWTRERGAFDGSRVVPTVLGPLQAHARIEVPAGWSLIQRGTLLVAADLAVLFALSAAAGLTRAGAWRWWRLRRRSLRGSYRLRLTVVLLLFFVVPLSVLTVWSFQRLRIDDAEKRELLVREFLRAVDRSGERPELEQASRRIGVPLLGYSVGRLLDASDELFGALSPFGLFLPPAVAQTLAPGGSLTATSTVPVAGTNVLLSYLSTRGARGERIVVAAPAVLEEETFDRRREDLVMLLLFGALSGVMAALWLSGLAARQFARPIGALRDAAVAVAAGERAPRLDQAPPSEFVPVFDAFRRMADDLRAGERALDAARRRTDAVLRTVASGVIAVDAETRVVLANPRAEALLGAVPAGTLLQQVSPSLAERTALFAASTKRDAAFEETWGEATVQGRFTRLDRDGVVITLDDVTQLAHAQRVLAWGEMARQVAHEIKNPLTPIRLGVQHLRRARDDGRPDFDAILERNVGTILTQIDRLDEIARAFSRYGTSPESAPMAEPTDVVAVVEEVLTLERMAEGAVQWESRVPDAGSATAMARAPELRDVVLNLLENARQAGASVVRVEVRRTPDAVTVEVRDNGTGIAADVLFKVFEPHFSTRTSGSGLGLAISRRLVDGWGGSLTIAQSGPEGTVVAMALRPAPSIGHGASLPS